MNIDIIPSPDESFQLDEAFHLIHKTVVPKELNPKIPEIDQVGVVQGLIDTDLEVEILIRFSDGLRRYGKIGFELDLKLND